jgi:glycosyltransferase involved in cell wall biosynthesis
MECSNAAMPDLAATAPHDTERPLRLLIVNSTLHIGGAEQVAATLAEHIDPARFAVSVCYLKENGLLGEQMSQAGVKLEPIPGLRPGRADYLTWLKLRRHIVANKVDVVHTHDVHGLVDATLCRLTLPSLRHVHTFHYGKYPERSPGFRRVERALWRFPDALVAVGQAQAAAIRGLYGIPRERLRILWNGVDDPVARGSAVSACLSPLPVDGIPAIVSVSTFFAQKGLEHLVDAAALLRDRGDTFRLYLAGNGPLFEPLNERVRRLRLESHVQFLDWVPQASKRLLPKSDVFVQSSLWEAMSIVVLEAMAAGRPMVITSVGENPHMIVDGESGLLVPPGDAAALAAALSRLLRDASLRAACGAAARARYALNFTTSHMTSAYEALYRELARLSAAASAPLARKIRAG